jgi:aminotransferase
MRPPTSRKAARFTESVIREMSRVARANDAVNLAQGFPDFPAPEAMKEAAVRAIHADVNQYAVTWGAPDLRAAITERAASMGLDGLDPDRHVTVTCGATEAMVATMLAVLDPGDEVIVLEPFYENYGPDCVLAGATPRFVGLVPATDAAGAPVWELDLAALEAAFGERTRAIVVNTPHNPTGKVFTQGELARIAELCVRHDVLAITDEIYDSILYDGAEHVSLATLPGMAERTITINGLSKTWSATGWRIGWCLASEEITGAIRKVHDFLTVGAPAPLQQAAAAALRFGPEYYEGLAAAYTERRDLLCGALAEVGFRTFVPGGAYYVMTDVSGLTEASDVDFAMELVRDGGVATVPGSSFHAEPTDGARFIRFCFAKRLETLERAIEVLRRRLV